MLTLYQVDLNTSTLYSRKQSLFVALCQDLTKSNSVVRDQALTHLIIELSNDKKTAAYTIHPNELTEFRRIKDLESLSEEQIDALIIQAGIGPARWLQGPIALTQLHKDAYNLRVYLMADRHDATTSCIGNKGKVIPIWDFLKLQVQANPDQVIDLLVEEFYDERERIQQMRTRRPTYITYVLASMQELSKYKQVRIHNTDIRGTGYTRLFNFVLLVLDVRPSLDEYWPVRDKFLQDINQGVRAIIDSTPLPAQIKLVPYPEVRQRLELEMHELTLPDPKLSQQVLDTLAKGMFHSKSKQVINSYKAFGNKLIDLYLLALLFSGITNVITYTGLYHTEVYFNFLKDLDFTVDLDITSPGTEITKPQCLSLDQVKQPWFS